MKAENFKNLSQNPYPGRGIVLGINDQGQAIQIYWIMGRSPNSQNRVFNYDETGRLFTEAADPSKVDDPSLIIYNAMLEASPFSERFFVVSNGAQTENVTAYAKNVRCPFIEDLAVHRWEYEPDKPNFTPRITGMIAMRKDDGLFAISFCILKKADYDDGNNQDCDRFYYNYRSIEPGTGRCVTTYSGDGNPLPAFCGEPLLMPLIGDSNEILQTYWEALNPDNRVSLAVKSINIYTGESDIIIKNRFKKV